MGFGDKSSKEKQREKESQKKSQELSAKEEAQWVDDDKGVKAKAKRAGDKAASAEEKERRKNELKELEKAEEEANSKLKGASKGSSKITRAEVQRNAALRNALAVAKQPAKTKKTTTVDAPKIEPNLNWQNDVIAASGIDDALAALNVSGAQPAGKMTFKQFEAENAERIKSENAGLKHSQLKDVIWKQWERSMDNPKNQTTA